MQFVPFLYTVARRGPHKKIATAIKSSSVNHRYAYKKTRQRPTLPLGAPSSTIGTKGLNFRVRNGNGCFPFVMVAGSFSNQNGNGKLKTIVISIWIFCLNKLYGQASRAISTG
jgi:hypothetical protein